MNVLATFQNDLWKFMDVRANGDFPRANLQNEKKIIMKKNGIYID